MIGGSPGSGELEYSCQKMQKQLWKRPPAVATFLGRGLQQALSTPPPSIVPLQGDPRFGSPSLWCQAGARGSRPGLRPVPQRGLPSLGSISVLL